MDNNTNILTASNLHREFPTAAGPVNVLRGLSLDIGYGEMATITGASGVGKSTLLHILGGLDQPDQGEVKISDASISAMSEAERAHFRNDKVGFVFQFHYLLDDFTALENVMVPIILSGQTPAGARERGEQLLQDVGLKDRQTHRPRELSGGEQQRVAVARALANEPDIVLADEPSGNLDTATGRKLHDLLFRLNADKGTSFVIATHNRELADACRNEYEMIDGKLQRPTETTGK